MKLKHTINYYLNLFGFYPKQFLNSLRGIPYYLKNYSKIKKILQGSSFKIKKLYPCLTDRFEQAGTLPLHYFYQDLYVANKIFLNNPQKHVDVGSRIDGFVSHIASFREITVLDLRNLENEIKNIKFEQVDLTDKKLALQNFSDSISCLHAIEHFGLGRYGDKIDVDGHIKGLNNIYNLLTTNGKFYFSTPIGNQRIEFDAHRVFSVEYLLNIFQNKYRIDSFAFINDNNVFFDNAKLKDDNIKSNFGCEYGCGIFEMTKL